MCGRYDHTAVLSESGAVYLIDGGGGGGGIDRVPFVSFVW
jgi:hypothetical protein